MLGLLNENIIYSLFLHSTLKFVVNLSLGVSVKFLVKILIPGIKLPLYIILSLLAHSYTYGKGVLMTVLNGGFLSGGHSLQATACMKCTTDIEQTIVTCCTLPVVKTGL